MDQSSSLKLLKQNHCPLHWDTPVVMPDFILMIHMMIMTIGINISPLRFHFLYRIVSVIKTYCNMNIIKLVCLKWGDPPSHPIPQTLISIEKMMIFNNLPKF